MALLEQEEDFSATMSLLEEVVAARGGKLCWLPKFTPEFQPMKCCDRCQNKTFNSKWLFGFIVLFQGLQQLLQGEKHRWQLQGLFAKNSLCWLRGDTWEVSKVLPLLRTVPQTSFKWCQITSTFFRLMQAYGDGATGLRSSFCRRQRRSRSRTEILCSRSTCRGGCTTGNVDSMQLRVKWPSIRMVSLRELGIIWDSVKVKALKGWVGGWQTLGSTWGGVVLQMWNIL